MLLPNNKNIRRSPAGRTTWSTNDVTVVPTNSIVEGFAALLAYDPDASPDANAEAMRASACNVVAGEVTHAVRDTTTDAGEVHVGDWIGLGAEGVLAIADSIAAASNHLLRTPDPSRARTAHHHRRRRVHARQHPPDHRVSRRGVSPRRRSKSTTAASRSTPTTSASSE